MRHHQQGEPRAAQIILQPLHHIKVQVVRRLVEDQQVRFGDQDLRQGDTFHLSARHHAQFLLQVRDLQFAEYLLHSDLVARPRADILHRLEAIQLRVLRQDTHLQSVPEGDLARIVRHVSGDDIEQRALAGAVLRDQRHTLALE